MATEMEFVLLFSWYSSLPPRAFCVKTVFSKRRRRTLSTFPCVWTYIIRSLHALVSISNTLTSFFGVIFYCLRTSIWNCIDYCYNMVTCLILCTYLIWFLLSVNFYNFVCYRYAPIFVCYRYKPLKQILFICRYCDI